MIPRCFFLMPQRGVPGEHPEVILFVVTGD